MKRVAIMISGGGSNMVTLVKSMTGNHPARPVLVMSNYPGAAGLERAAELDVPTAVVDHRAFGKDRAAFDGALIDVLTRAQPDVICLAGFMRILTPAFADHWAGRLINIHPSLLPKYKGLNTHARAIEARDIESGCTVHQVTAKLDDGPILGQGRVPVLQEDSAEDLAARVLKMEHQLYPAVLRRFVLGETAPLYLPTA